MLDKLNLNQLRVFVAVHRARSMSVAAQELHMTQPGVSQHVRALEESVGKVLFDRFSGGVVPTEDANVLFEGCTRGIHALEESFQKISQEEIGGPVAIGMPPQFAYSVVLKRIAELKKKFPAIVPRITIGLGETLNEKLLDGSLDFAFVDAFSLDPRIGKHGAYEEVLELVISKDCLKKFGKIEHRKSDYERLPYVCYLPGEPLIREWFQHHLPKKRMELAVEAFVDDTEGVASMILQNVGAGVLPRYYFEELRKEGHKLVAFQGRERPLVNLIHVAYLDGKTQSLAVKQVLSGLMDFK